MTSPLVRGTLSGGARFAGRYRIVRALAAGGMGAVYEVVDEATQSPRALKVMLPSVFTSPEHRQRFEREARVTGSIESEHLVRITDAGVDGDVPFLVMELLRGEDLRAVLRERGALPSDVVVPYLRQVALALEKTHAAGIVHRDLKPANLFLTRRDDGSACIKILDFGVAKLSVSASAQETSTVGTPIFMAPEQARGEGGIDHRADLLALAHVAYNMLVGEPYFAEELERADSILGVILAVVEGPREAPSVRAARRGGVRLPSTFDAWFLRAAAAQPELRYASARDEIEGLAQALSGTARSVQHRTVPMRAVGAAAEAGTPPTVTGITEHGRGGDARVMPVAGGFATPRAPLRVDVAVSGDVLREFRGEERGLPRWAWAVGGAAALAIVGVVGVAGILVVRAQGRPTPAEQDEEDDEGRAPRSVTMKATDCVGDRCAPFPVSDRKRVDPLAHLGEATKLAAQVARDPCIFSVMFELGPGGDVDLDASRLPTLYSYLTPTGTVAVRVQGEQLVAVTGAGGMHVGPCKGLPKCTLAQVVAVAKKRGWRPIKGDQALVVGPPIDAWTLETASAGRLEIPASECASASPR